MNFEYMLYIFLLIGLIIGAIRGSKKEFFNFISLLVSFVVVILTYKPLSSLAKQINLENIYENEVVKVIAGLFGMSYFTFEFIIIGLLTFIIVYLILKCIFKILFFNSKKMLKNSKLEGSKLLGAFIGIFNGLVLGAFILIPLATVTFNIDFNGIITKFIINVIPSFKELLEYLGVLL